MFGNQNAPGAVAPVVGNPFNFDSFKALGMNVYGDDLYVNPTPVQGYENLVPNGTNIVLDNGQYGLSLKLTSGSEVIYFPVHKSTNSAMASSVAAWKLEAFTAARDYKGFNVQNPDSTGRPVDQTKYNQAIHGNVLSEVNVVAGQTKIYALAV